MLYEAHQAEADIYAPEILAKAKHSWLETLQEWNMQNKKSGLHRDYSKVGFYARETISIAKQAIITAQVQKDSLQNSIRLETVIVQEMIKKVRNRFNEYFFDQVLNHNLIEGELLLSESEAAYKRNHFPEAARKIREAYKLIGHSDNDMSRRLKEYFAQLPQWQSWVTETIQKSREDSSKAIIIDKIDRKCKVYENGELVLEFPAEFGANWIGHKKLLGDDATPEGHYHVKKKKEGKHTIYYLALVIDYPNGRDIERFYRAKARGEVPMDAEIGGLIEIHGGGGEGKNWTNGCVALRNSDMEILYRLADIGTPITIVGALNANFTIVK